MTWTMADIIFGVIMLIIIGVTLYLINDARKKGVPSYGASCGGCPSPYNNDGTIKKENEAKNSNSDPGGV